MHAMRYKTNGFCGQLDIEIRILPRIINDAQRSSGNAGEKWTHVVIITISIPFIPSNIAYTAKRTGFGF